VLLSSGTIFLFLKKKLSEMLVVIVFAALILFDLVSVDRQYVNNDDFVSALQVDNPYQPTMADKEILKDQGHFRVLDMSTEGQRKPGRASYFHNSLFGYHAAKLGRYNDLLEFHIYKNNMNVLNMLNTKYIIAEEQGEIFPYTNTDANGNAWFVSNLAVVDDANTEILALDSLNTKKTAVIDRTIFELRDLSTSYKIDSLATISLKSFQPNYLKYESKNTNIGFAVFSEIFYKYGWQAYIDGKEVAHQRVNYVLRGMEIPQGEHIIEFKFQPTVVKTGSTIALASSIIFGLLLILGVFVKLWKKRE
ncbi:MAG: YfhO family protein, partial [Winogradskyella sp.]|uniref:YfhO family protein n=1 Tax=Winogradskyella sp. TaxID=1883156 RepID=UPI0018266418|nr:YfhO family protein [Winogradskyella sp.]